jgi:hypothetical protein
MHVLPVWLAGWLAGWWEGCLKGCWARTRSAGMGWMAAMWLLRHTPPLFVRRWTEWAGRAEGHTAMYTNMHMLAGCLAGWLAGLSTSRLAGRLAGW